MQLIEVSSAQSATIVRLSYQGQSVEVPPAESVDRAGEIYKQTGVFPSFTYLAPASPVAAPTGSAGVTAGSAGTVQGASTAVQASPPPADALQADTDDAPPSEPRTGSALGYSAFGAGNQILDAAAQSRFAKIYARLEAAGVTGLETDRTPAGYQPGTRMAEIGYRNQEARRAEFLRMMPARDAVDALNARVVSEGRSDVAIGSHEFANAIESNGKIRVKGLRIGEQAIRGLMGRTKSPALSYLLGLRERIAVEHARPLTSNDPKVTLQDTRALHADVAAMAEVLRHECRRAPEVALKLRTRTRPGDVYAIVSPSYVAADAPEVTAEILSQLPADTRAAWSYDGRSTGWTLRFDTWTSTPVSEQAVGEPFKGSATLGSADNGTSCLEGGGGVVILACLNAGIYVADAANVKRRHRGKILIDVAAMLRAATEAINVLALAWGVNRAAEVAIPEKVTIEQAIPGFYRHLLTDRRSELVTVLPGRTETHVKNLSLAYAAERRDSDRIVRADLAQGFTRYAQAFTAEVQRDAEKAIGKWIVAGREVGFAGRAKD